MTSAKVDPARVGVRPRLGIYLLFLAVYLVGASGHFYSTDHVAVYLTAQSIVEDGDLSITPTFNTVKGRDGEYFSVFGPGQAFAATPLYALGRGVDDLGGGSVQKYFRGYPVTSNATVWGGTLPIFFVSLFNQFLAPLVCVVLFMFLLELGFSPGVSFVATLFFGLGSAVFSGAHEFFQHPLETLLLLSTIYVLFCHRHDLAVRHSLLAGLLLGFGIFTRNNLALVLPWILVYLVVMCSRPQSPGDPVWHADGRGGAVGKLVRRLRSRRLDAHVLRCAFAFVLPGALALAAMTGLNYYRFHELFGFRLEITDPAHGFSIDYTLVGLYGNLLSPGRSIFVYSPPALLGLFGASRFYQKYPAEALLSAAIVGTYLLFYSSYSQWHGDWGWGPRYLLAIVPLLVIPSAYVLESRRGVLLGAVLCTVGLGVQVLGVAVNVSYVINHLGPNVPWDSTYLFDPGKSPVPTHLKALLHNRDVDLWLVYVWEQFGTRVLLLTLMVPAALMAVAVFLLREFFAGLAPPLSSALVRTGGAADRSGVDPLS